MTRRAFNWKAYNQEMAGAATEMRNDLLLKRQIVDAGVRAMALKLHPDVGGSQEDMARLNRCAAALRREFELPKPIRIRKVSEATERKRKLSRFLRQESVLRRGRRRMRQSDSWGCWIGDGRAEEWITPGGHPIYDTYYPFPVDLGFPIRGSNDTIRE